MLWARYRHDTSSWRASLCAELVKPECRRPALLFSITGQSFVAREETFDTLGSTSVNKLPCGTFILASLKRPPGRCHYILCARIYKQRGLLSRGLDALLQAIKDSQTHWISALPSGPCTHDCKPLCGICLEAIWRLPRFSQSRAVSLCRSEALRGNSNPFY